MDFGMNSEDGELAVLALVERLAGAPMHELAEHLPEAVALIASMHAEVRTRRVAEAIADALLTV
jgi:hypothetical protein